MQNVRLINGYYIEVDVDKIGLTHHDDKYYIQLIEDNGIKEVQISLYEWRKITRAKNDRKKRFSK